MLRCTWTDQQTELKESYRYLIVQQQSISIFIMEMFTTMLNQSAITLPVFFSEDTANTDEQAKNAFYSLFK